jgi:hypothetical protein
LEWVGSTFGSAWALESETAFAANPPSCYIALEKDSLIEGSSPGIYDFRLTQKAEAPDSRP